MRKQWSLEYGIFYNKSSTDSSKNQKLLSWGKGMGLFRLKESRDVKTKCNVWETRLDHMWGKKGYKRHIWGQLVKTM